jgi:hypothetical protein
VLDRRKDSLHAGIMRSAAFALASLAMLAAGCTPGGTPHERSASEQPSDPAAATNVPVGLSAVCGAGTKECPTELLDRFSRDAEEHGRGYLFATPDAMFVGASGCGVFPAPMGTASVTADEIRLTVDWPVRAVPDCIGNVFGFVHFAQPVFDMEGTITVRVHNLVTHETHIERGLPAPDLAAWSTGRGLSSFDPPCPAVPRRWRPFDPPCRRVSSP